MNTAIGVAFGTALVLLMVGLLGRTARLSARIDPYLDGLGGRPSRLLVTETRRKRLPVALVRLASLWPDGGARLSLRLMQSGRLVHPSDFRLEQITWGLVGTLSTWVLLASLAASGFAVDVRTVAPLSLLAVALGFLGRDWWLGREIQKRTAILARELPTAIDLITLSIMAGESLPAAFERVGRIMSPGIGWEFQVVVADARGGLPFAEALEKLEDRMPLPGVSRLVDAICTGIERGSPLADVLIAQADDSRQSHRRALVEAAGRREVLMLIPVVFLILPVVIVFALLPGLASLDMLVP
jgi:tight adherence protein C